MTEGRGRGTSPAITTELRMVMRMRRWTRTVLVLFLSLLLGLPATAAWAGGSKVRVVKPGESIQAAIDAASPGDTILVKPGTYAEAPVVQTDDLTLKSKGTVLTMPDSADNICTELSGGTVISICALGPVTNWTVRHNIVRRNNKADCGEGGTSGTGILLQGASDNEVSKNLVVGNRGDSPVSGGIVLVTAEPEEPGGEAIAPSGNVVRKNVALRNRPFDISWDGTGNRFVDNRCRTSQPDGLCD
jgi:nitrous oxidase accessory protein NosD